MMRKRRGVYLLFMLSMLFVGACGKRPTEIDNIDTAEELNQAFIDVSKAVEIVLSPDEGAQDMLATETFAEKRYGTNGDIRWEIVYSRRNEESGFYSIYHELDVEENEYLVQFFRVDLKTNEREMLYESRNPDRLTEIEVTDSFLYWTENVLYESGGVATRVMQYELATGEVRCIAESEKMVHAELCVSEQYVVWCEHSGEGWWEIVFYDVHKQEFHTLPGIKSSTLGGQGSPEILAGFRPFSSLDIIDGGITFFSEAGGGNTYINRYDLNTRTMDAQLLIEGRGTEMAGCFSSKRYIGWQLGDRLEGRKYYYYDRDSGSLYCIRGENKKAGLLSQWFSDYLYFHYKDPDKDGDFLFVLDPASGKVWQQKLEGYGRQFREYGSGQVCVEVLTGEEQKLFTIQIPQ